MSFSLGESASYSLGVVVSQRARRSTQITFLLARDLTNLLYFARTSNA